MRKPKPKKPPVIRRGQRKPFIKATVEQINERIELVENLLGQGVKTGQIKRAIISQYGVAYGQVLIYIARARANIQKRFSQNKEEHRADSFSFYEAIAAPNSKASAGARLRARQRIDELLGLDAPRRTEFSGPDGAPIATEDKTPTPRIGKARLNAMIATLESMTEGSTDGHSNGETRNGE